MAIKRQRGCTCSDEQCKAREAPDPREPRVHHMSVDTSQLRAEQRFNTEDMTALAVETYQSASQGHVQMKTEAQLPEFLSIDAPGRTLFVSTRGMRDVHELVATLGELMAAQGEADKRKSWKAYRDSQHRDVVQAHQEFNEELYRYGKAHQRTGRFNEKKMI